MAKVQLNIQYNHEQEQYFVLVDGKLTRNLELIGLEVLSALKKQAKPKKQIQRFLD